MSSLQVEVVAADHKVWSGQARAVYGRTTEGELGILPGHQPILAVLAGGTVRLETASGQHELTIDSGFLSVDHDTVTVVADTIQESSLGAS